MTDTRTTAGVRFAECRSLGHAWRHRGAIGADTHHETFRPPFGMTSGVVGILSGCTVCKTERVKWITRSGETVPRYHYPDGYARHGEEVLSPRQWRSNYVATLFDAFSYQAQGEAS